MKHGKISESILKRSVLKQLHTEDDEDILGPGVGCDFGAVRVGKKAIALSTSVCSMEFENAEFVVKSAIVGAINNTAVSGCGVDGILVNLLIPTIWNEASLKDISKAISRISRECNVAVLGGHTQVIRGLKNLIVSVTAVGHGDREFTFSQKIEPGMDIVVTKEAGLFGTAILANEKEDELRTRYNQPFIDKAKEFDNVISIQSEAAVAVLSGACSMHDVSEGGIFAALWEFAAKYGVGLEIDLKKIPIRQETIEICEFFDMNPYKLLSTGSVLIATRDGSGMVRELQKAGIVASIIGVTTDNNDRVIIQGEERRFLETAQNDELYKIYK